MKSLSKQNYFDIFVGVVSFLTNIIFVSLIYFVLYISYSYLSYDNFLNIGRNIELIKVFFFVIVDSVYFFYFIKNKRDKLKKSIFYKNIIKFYSILFFITAISSLFFAPLSLLLFILLFFFVISTNVFMKNKNKIYYLISFIIFSMQFSLSLAIIATPTTPSFMK